MNPIEPNFISCIQNVLLNHFPNPWHVLHEINFYPDSKLQREGLLATNSKLVIVVLKATEPLLTSLLPYNFMEEIVKNPLNFRVNLTFGSGEGFR